MKDTSTTKKTILLLTLAGCLIYAMSAGIRSNYGILLNPIIENSGITYSYVSFALALAQLVFGIMQPVFGIIAMKYSGAFVLRRGVILLVAGLLLLPLCKDMWMLLIVLGGILPSGTAALSFGIIMGVLTPQMPGRINAAVSGIVTASSGIGSTVFSPLIQTMMVAFGLLGTMLFIGIPALLLLPVSIAMCHSEQRVQNTSRSDQVQEESFGKMIGSAIKNRSYLCLMAGFFTCGFHMALIETHFYSQIVSYGHSGRIAAFAFSVYGIATMAGAVLSGILCSRIPMKYVLGGLYGSRCLMIVSFLALPKSIISIYIFIFLLGLTGNSTVPPTSGLVGQMFGAVKLAALFGIVFAAHQVGSFFSSWLGGVCLSGTGTYTIIWLIDALFCLMASAVSFMINEKRERME